MSNVSNFNTSSGVGVTLNGGEQPAFFIYPNDVAFLEKLSELYKASKEYTSKAVEKRKEIKIVYDDNGIPENIDEYISMMKDDFNFVMKQIDDLLGEGVTEKVFAGRLDEELLSAFMDFISSEVEKNRESTVNKYTKNRAQRRADKKVME